MYEDGIVHEDYPGRVCKCTVIDSYGYRPEYWNEHFIHKDETNLQGELFLAM